MIYKRNHRIDTAGTPVVRSGRVMLIAEAHGVQQGLAWGWAGQELFALPGTFWRAYTEVWADDRRPDEAVNLLPVIANRLLINSRLEVAERINHALAELVEAEGRSFRVRMQELGLICGCCRERAGAIVGQMVKAGVVAREGALIHVWDLDALEVAA